MLVDSGSSDSFISASIVQELKLQTEIKTDSADCEVALVNDYAMASHLRVRNLEWSSGKYKDTWDFEVLQMRRFDVIIGADWLWERNPRCQWRLRQIRVRQKRRWYSLVTMPVPSVQQMPILSFIELQKELRKEPEMEVCAITPISWLSEKGVPEPTYDKFEKMRDSVPQQFRKLLESYRKSFPDKLPPVGNRPSRITHKIEVEPNTIPWFGPLYRLTSLEQDELQEQLEQMMSQGIIQPSTSPYAAPIILVRKKDGSYRLCVDFRRLNSRTKVNRYPVPLIDDLIDQVAEAFYFSKLDLTSGYWQIPLHPPDREKTAFRCRFGHFEFRMMPMGLVNAGATFQQEMNHLLRKWLNRSVVVYLDDILVYSKSVESHHQHVNQVLSALEQAGYYLNPTKCEFASRSIDYLGVVVGEGQIRVQQDKVSKVRNWKTPTNPNAIKSFLGLVGFYRRFIQDFSAKSSILTGLTKKNGEFVWTDVHQEAFDALKIALTTAPCLRIPRPSDELVVHTDASETASGATLSVATPKGFQPCAFASKTFTAAQRNYSAYQRELLALDWALQHWRPYLLDKPFIVYTDNTAVQHFQSQAVLTPIQARVMERIQQFPFTLRHVAGVDNCAADSLSRTVYTLLPPVKDDEKWKETFRAAQFEDEELLRSLDRGPETVWKVSDGFIKRRVGKVWKIAMPENLDVRRQTFELWHKSAWAGHPGHRRLATMLRKVFSWSGLDRQLTKFIAECTTCAITKPTHQPKANLVQPFQIPKRPWQMVSIDFVTGLPQSSDGFTSFVTIVDRFSRWLILVPTRFPLQSQEVIKILEDKLIRPYGIPDELLSDRDSRFRSPEWKTFLNTYNISHKQTAPYHPEADGITERANATILGYIRIFATDHGGDWNSHLATIEMAYNYAPHKSTGKSPVEILRGCQVIHPIVRSSIAMQSDQVSHGGSDSSDRHRIWKEVTETMQRSQESMLKSVNKGRRPIDFSKVQHVYVKSARIRKGRREAGIPAKINNAWCGPYRVLKHISKVQLELQLPSHWKCSTLFHVKDLKPAPISHVKSFRNARPGALSHPDDGSWFAAEGIIDERKDPDGSSRFLVKWTGYPRAESTWEPIEHLEHCKQLITAYRRSRGACTSSGGVCGTAQATEPTPKPTVNRNVERRREEKGGRREVGGRGRTVVRWSEREGKERETLSRKDGEECARGRAGACMSFER